MFNVFFLCFVLNLGSFNPQTKSKLMNAVRAANIFSNCVFKRNLVCFFLVERRDGGCFDETVTVELLLMLALRVLE